jgi:hypothetical protein
VRALDAAAQALQRALLQPMLGLLNVRQSTGIRLASIWASLKTPKAVSYNRQQNLLSNTIHTSLIDWSILKVDHKIDLSRGA